MATDASLKAELAFWTDYEESPTDIGDVFMFLDQVRGYIARGRTIAWRGQPSAGWGLHSTLLRRLWWTQEGGPPTEQQLQRKESETLQVVRRWGLHSGPRGRLSSLELLATMRHYGCPTRLIDITFEPHVALYFAAEECEAQDGRLFAIDVTDRLINYSSNQDWEEHSELPWVARPRPDWCGRAWAWRPAPFDARIAAQHGGFLFGGVPTSAGGQVPRRNEGRWSASEWRASASVALRPHKLPEGRGRLPGQPVFTARIPASAKNGIREYLREAFDMSAASLFPDFAGLADHGFADLARKPR